jgi:2-methylcitrate dehydratase PrpD
MNRYQTLTSTFAEFVSSLEWANIPSEAREAALYVFADWLANAVAGSKTPFGKALYTIAGRIRGQGRSHLAGSLELTHPLIAALVNSGSSHTLEFDDTHRGTLYHPGSPVIGAAFAFAEDEGCKGEDFLAGIVAGYEVSIRIADAINPSHYQIWHTTGTVGTLGAGAAACRVAKLDATTTLNALGLAGTQAAGLWEILPSAPNAKGLHPAKASHSGLLAAMLARERVEGPSTILEGPRGFFKAMVPAEPKIERLTTDLGKVWRILETTFKAYPTCGHTMTPIEAAFSLRREIDPNRICRITIYTNSAAVRIAGNDNPENEFQAKFSIPYCVAVALLYGQVTQAEFTHDILEDLKVRGLMEHMKLVVDEEFEQVFGNARPTRIEAITTDGRRFVTQAYRRKGDPELPLSREEKRNKFIQLAGNVWGEKAATSLVKSMEKIPDVENMSEWLRNHLTLSQTYCK